MKKCLVFGHKKHLVKGYILFNNTSLGLYNYPSKTKPVQLSSSDIFIKHIKYERKLAQ